MSVTQLHGYVKLGTSDLISLAEARKQAKILRAEITAVGVDPRAEERAKKAVLTLDEFFTEHYLPYATPRKRSIKRDEQIYRLQIQPTFGKTRINQITRQQILALAAMHRNNGLSASSTDHVSKLLRRLMSLAVQWGMLDKNPASRIELFNEDNQVEHYQNDEQLQRLVTVLKSYPSRTVALICTFLLATGCRVNEALTAQWSWWIGRTVFGGCPP
jgi:site-specific recombinase XerD